MKKLILILSSILLAVFILFTLLDWGGDYQAERELWGISKEFIILTKSIETAPDYSVNRLTEKLRSYIKKNQRTKYAAQAQLLIGNLFMLKKDFVKSRAEYQKVGGLTKKQGTISVAAANIAKTYELEGNWSSALSIYKNVIKRFPTSQTGFTIPVYIARYYQSKDLTTQANAAYAQASDFYRNLSVKHTKSPIEYNSLRLIVLCEFEQKKWADAVTASGNLMLKYPTGPVLRQALETINNLCVMQLRDYDKAISIYKQFKIKYPKHGVNPILNKMIAALEELKSKGVVIGAKVK